MDHKPHRASAEEELQENHLNVYCCQGVQQNPAEQN